MQQTSPALALEKIDDNGMVLNGWLARIHHGQKKGFPCRLHDIEEISKPHQKQRTAGTVT